MTHCARCNRLISDPEAALGRRIAGKRCERCNSKGIVPMYDLELREQCDYACPGCGGMGRVAVDDAGAICPTCAVCERAEKGSEEG